MIRVVHNAVDQVLDGVDYENLDELLGRCSRSRDGNPHLFTRIRIDGLDLPEDSFDRLEDISIEGVKKIEVESRPTREIALSSLQHSSEYVAAVRDAVDRVVDLFRRGRSKEANELLAQVSDALGVLVAAISGVASAMPQRSKNLLDPVGELVHWLDQVLEGQTNGDWVQVADILEYEVDPRLDDWALAMQKTLTESS